MNAKEELKAELKGKPDIKCAIIRYDRTFVNAKIIKLYPGYTTEQLEEFFNNLDFEYDSGFGGQELYGYVWLENNNWLERYEYDGSECWECKSYPNVEDGYGEIKF
jgi:hypothetical protein